MRPLAAVADLGTMRSLPIMRLLCLALLLTKCGSDQVRRATPDAPPKESLPKQCQCEEWISPIPGLDAAMEGHDPFRADPLSHHDPGVKQKIFEPLRYRANGRIALQPFIGRARKLQRCNQDFTATTVRSFVDYKLTTRSSKREAHNVDSKVEAGIFGFSVKASAGYGEENTKEDQEIISFFKETSGEIIVSTTECITHSVAIAPFYKPVFTEAFKTALKALAAAANNPNSTESNLAAKLFLTNYGTHFLEETQLGAKLVMIEGFYNRSRDASQERQRKQCALKSAHASVGGGFLGIISAEISYSHESESCQESAENAKAGETNTRRFVKVRSIGTFPSNIREMSPVTSPAPISFRTSKLTALMKTEWLEANSLHGINATVLAHFLDEKIDSYCKIMFNEDCNFGLNVCAYLGNTCPARHSCQEDDRAQEGYSCVPRYGAVIIVGGWDGHSTVKSVEVLNGPQLPELPVAGSLNTLTVVGDTLYSCGGWNEQDGDCNHCFKINTAAIQPSWSMTNPLPTRMAYHTAVAVGTHIWFVHENQLHDMDTGSELFRTYHLQFIATGRHCMVSNGTHSYLIGGGADQKEIWLGSSPSAWQMVGRLPTGRSEHACLWMGSDVYITGGNSKRTTVEVLDTRTHELRTRAGLTVGRQQHEMMVLDGSPAVVAGWVLGSTPYTDSIEVYDINKNEWTVSTRKLRTGRDSYGLVQLLQADN